MWDLWSQILALNPIKIGVIWQLKAEFFSSAARPGCLWVQLTRIATKYTDPIDLISIHPLLFGFKTNLKLFSSPLYLLKMSLLPCCGVSLY